MDKEIETLLWRWKKHIRILELLKTTNIESSELEELYNDIDNHFKEKILSKL